MITKGIREIKENLSKYLHMVKEGEDVIVTERGTPVAVIKSLSEKGSIDKRLLKAAAQNLIQLPKRSGSLRSRWKDLKRYSKGGGKTLSEIIMEERRASW